MRVDPHPGTGVEVRGVDLRRADEADFGRVEELFHRHGLAFLRDQQLSEDDHIALARRFGTINVNRFFIKHPGHPEIAMVTKEADQRLNVGGFWHTDHSYDAEPALGSILVARELPPAGGNTHFLSTYDAFAALPTPLQERLRTLRAIHSAKHAFGTTSSRASDGGSTRKPPPRTPSRRTTSGPWPTRSWSATPSPDARHCS